MADRLVFVEPLAADWEGVPVDNPADGLGVILAEFRRQRPLIAVELQRRGRDELIQIERDRARLRPSIFPLVAELLGQLAEEAIDLVARPLVVAFLFEPDAEDDVLVIL